MPHSQGISNNRILSPINPIPSINTYLFNIALPSTPRPQFKVLPGGPVQVLHRENLHRLYPCLNPRTPDLDLRK